MSVFYEEYRALVNTVNNARRISRGELCRGRHRASHRIVAGWIVERRTELRIRRRSQISVLVDNRVGRAASDIVARTLRSAE